MSSRIKVYELAKELGQDSQHVVDVVQRLGIDIKNAMSVLGTEEVRTIRDYFRKNSLLQGKGGSKVTNTVTEKRVGATVIRRRAKTASEKVEEAPVEEAPKVEAEPEEVEAPIETAAEQTEAPVEEVEAQEEPQSEEVQAKAEEQEEPAPQETPAEPSAPAAETSPTLTAAETKAQTAEAKAAAAASSAEERRRRFPSIIKKMGTEVHLSTTIGAKRTITPKREETPKPAAKPGSAEALRPGMVKRVKEVELVTPEAAKEAKRRVTERTSTVFKSTDYLKRELVHSTKKKKAVINRPAMKTQLTTAAAHKRVVEMGATVTIADMAQQMGIKATQLMTKLMGMGVTATINQAIDHDTASLVGQELGFEVKQKVFREDDHLPTLDLAAEALKPRPPVVTIMGHVDHGKTSLLDAIRQTKVAAGEAGGITQHVGAYTVKLPKGKIAFIDTPGHEAFTAMRARGAKVTDIVILVVSAVDGVMPQTLESVAHSKAAGVPIIVAINKIDLPDGNPDRIKQTLAGHGLNPEEWGGDTIYVGVSAKTRKGIDQLLEAVLLQAEVMELKANFETPARGVVVESRLDKARGPVAIVLIQQGTLKPGVIVVSGTAYGKVKAMLDHSGKRLDKAEPGDPVEILGMNGVPGTGDLMVVMPDDKAARALAEARLDQTKRAIEMKPKMSLEDLLTAASATGEKELRLILRTDVQGSVEALKEAVSKLPQNKVKLKLLHAGTGGITESDINLASASKAVILGFNIRPDVNALKLAEREGVVVKTYSIIYELLDEAKNLLEGLLDSEVREKVIGRAEVRNVFHIPKIGAIAGSSVIDGKVQRGCYLRLLRDSRVIYEGKISSLKRFKDDVREVAQGFECGIGLEGFNDVKMGDQFEAYVKEEFKGAL